MKKILLVIMLFVVFGSIQAGHIQGGDITWECLSNGKFIFYMNMYRDCSGIQGSRGSEVITITGSPLPTNGVASITMNFNTQLFNANNQGDLTQYCSSSYGTQPSCANGSVGIYQFLPYISDTIQLTGTPPALGWHFSYSPACCSGMSVNLNGTGRTLILSKMFGLPNLTMDTCYFSSPRFAEFPSTRFCRKDTIDYSVAAYSNFGDSLTFSNARVVSGSASSPTPYPFKSGFSINSITPGTASNVNNIPYTLNSRNGDIRFSVHSGAGLGNYMTNSQIDAYRSGVRLASISRVMPILIQSCGLDTIPSGAQNTVPKLTPPFSINGVPSYSTSVVAGSSVNLTVHYYDNDITGVGTGRQEITLVPSGESLSRDLINAGNCLLPNDTSCATFTFAPILDTNLRPVRYAYKALGVGYAFLNWNTDCDDLTRAGIAKTHYFTFKIFDDHCPLPKTTYKTVAVTVTPSPSCNVITSLQNVNLMQKISLYPNPTNGQFNITLGAAVDFVEVQIRNIQGQLVQEQQFKNKSNLEIDIECKAGVYFIQMRNEKGETANLKVVKQ